MTVYYKNPFNEILSNDYDNVKNDDYYHYFDVKFRQTREEARKDPDFIQIEKYINP